MSKKMQKALLAFINEDVDQARKLMRQVFVESAQKVNKELEEQYEAEVPEEDLSEDLDKEPEDGLTDEVEYKLEEGFGDWDSQDDQDAGGSFGSQAPVQEADDSVEDDAVVGADDAVQDGDDSVSSSPVEVDGDAWNEIQSMVDELTEIFDSIKQDDDSELEMDSPEEDGFGEEESSDEFSDVPMGDEKFGESYKMKPVTVPAQTAEKSKSPVASVAKSPVQGVKPIQIKDGSVEVSDSAFKNSDTETAKVEDNNNVMDSAKGMMKDVSVPKQTAEKSRSVLPKK